MMKCQLNEMNEIHNVLISKQISYKSYKEICSGEKKKVNLAYWGNWGGFKVENNSLLHYPARQPNDYIHGKFSKKPYDWEVLYDFFAIYNIEPNWLHCNYTYGWYDEELGGWTGCMGKV